MYQRWCMFVYYANRLQRTESKSMLDKEKKYKFTDSKEDGIKWSTSEDKHLYCLINRDKYYLSTKVDRETYLFYVTLSQNTQTPVTVNIDSDGYAKNIQPVYDYANLYIGNVTGNATLKCDGLYIRFI